MADSEQLLITLGVQDKGASQQISAINKEIKALDKGFKSANSVSKDFEKSTEGLKTKLGYLEKSFTANNTKLDSYKKKVQETNDAIAKKQAELQKLNSAEEVNQKAVNKATEQLEKMKTTLRTTEQNINLTENEMKRLTNEINNTNSALKNEALDKYKKKMSDLGNSIEGTGGKIKNVGQGISSTGMSLMTLSAPLVAFGAYATKSAIDFESAFTGVKKTVTATDEQLAKLKDGILDMSKHMPESASDIAKVAESAGQLGIKTENIESFTKSMVMLGDSTNLSSEDAATALARLANITGMSQTNFDRLGSVIVALGNNMATTESEITDMGLRLAGAGHQVGMSEAQILSFAGALSSVGIEAEAGGSAFSKVMVDMQLATEKGGKDLDNFAKVAGMSSENFQKSFKEDASGALIAFIKGLQDTSKNGTSAIKTLDDMGITEVRMRDALLRASGASDKFTKALQIGTTAWSENTALTKEAETRYATMASKIEMAKNKLKALGIELGEDLMPFVSEFIGELESVVNWFGSLDKSTQEAIIKFGLLTFATGGVLTAVGKVTTGVGGLVTVFGKIVGGLGSLTPALATGAEETIGLGTAFSALSSIALPLTGVIAGVGTAIYAYTQEQEAMSKSCVTSKEDLGLVKTALLELNGVHVQSREELEKSGLAYKQLGDDLGEDFKKKVEESTKKIAEFNYELGLVNVDGVVTQEEADGLTSRVNNMADSALNAIKAKSAETQSELSKMFLVKDNAIDESEKKVLDFVNSTGQKEIEEVTKLKADIQEIYKKAVDNKRDLNEQEIKDVQDKLARISQIELEATANNQAEQLYAKNQFTERIKTADAETASQMLVDRKKAIEDETTNLLANYQTQLDLLAQQKTKAHELGDAEAEANIQTQIDIKTKEKDGIIEVENKKWEETKKVMDEQQPQMIAKYNQYDGTMLSEADIHAQQMLELFKKNSNGLEQVTQTGWYNIQDKVTGAVQNCYVEVDKNTGQIVGAWNNCTQTSGGYTDKLDEKVREVGKTHGDEQGKISSALIALTGAWGDATGQITSHGGQIIGTMHDVTTATDGTKQGIIDVNGTPIDIKTNSSGVITEIGGVKQAIDGIPRDVYINLRTTFSEEAIKYGVADGNRFIKHNDVGTYNAVEGLSTVDENGWELANNNNVTMLGSYYENSLASIPSGTSIRTHMQSVADMKAEISKQVNSLLASKSFNNDSNTEIDYNKLANVMFNAFQQGLANISMNTYVDVDANGMIKKSVDKTLDTLSRQTRSNTVSRGR